LSRLSLSFEFVKFTDELQDFCCYVNALELQHEWCWISIYTHLYPIKRDIGVLKLDQFIYDKPKHKRFLYPDVASALSRYCVSLIEDTDIAEDCNVKLSELASQLWSLGRIKHLLYVVRRC